MTLITFAVPFESAGFRKLARPQAPPVQILHTGMGGEAAQRALASEIARNRPDRVIVSGFAGALDARLAVGDLVSFEGDQEASPPLAIHQVRFGISDVVLASVSEKNAFRASTGADVIDMESLALVDLCKAHQVPFSVLRCISDDARHDLPAPSKILARSADSPVPLLLFIARRPRRWAGFWRFVRNCHAAQSRLAEGLLGSL